MSKLTHIRGASIVSMDDSIGDLPKGDILIEGDRIAAVATILDVGDTYAEVIDASGMIASPGFCDTHRHTWQTQLKGVAVDWSLFDYACLMRTIYSVCYTPDDAYLGNYLGAIEAINSGITSVVDHSHLQMTEAHSDALAQGLIDSGVRGVFCYGFYRNPVYTPGDSLNIPDIIAEVAGPLSGFHKDNAARIRDTHFPSQDGLVRFGISTSELCTFSDPKQVTDEIAFARQLEPALISSHVGMGLNEGFRIIPILHEAGQLADDLLFVHGAYLTDGDLALLKQHGGWTSTTPETELQMGMGYPVLERVEASGRTPSLGIDIVSNYAGDMFAQMRLMLQTMRFRDFETAGAGIPISSRYAARKMLKFATLGGATVMGLDRVTGSLTPGKKADIVLTRTDSINMSPVTDPVAALIFYAHASDVDSVFIDGVARKRNGTIVGFDWAGQQKRLRNSAEAISQKFRLVPQDAVRQAWAPYWGLERAPA